MHAKARRAPSLAIVLFSLFVAADAHAILPDTDPCNPMNFCAPSNCGMMKCQTYNVNCGVCATGETCVANYCQPACAPTSSCAAQAASCGQIWDGCKYVACGTCTAGFVCAANNSCVPPADAEPLCNGTRASTALTPNLFDMICGVGSQNGSLAISWLGQWFSVVPQGTGGWALTNAAAAVTPLSVAPLDTGDGTTVDPVINDDFDNRSQWLHARNAVQKNYRLRQYSVDVGGRHYEVAIRQKIFDHKVDLYALQLRGDVTFTITSPDPLDGQNWTLILTPKRLPIGYSADAIEPSVSAAEGNGQSAVATQSAFFNSRNVIYDANVELDSAVKSVGYRATDVAAVADPALNNAIDQMLTTPQTLYSQYSVDAASHWGDLLGSYGSGVVSFDKRRSSQFFMKTRSSSGYSNPGVDRPLIDTEGHQWSFHQPLASYTTYWPFLAGVCGLEARMSSFLEGSFQAGADSCFEGMPTSAYVRGSLSFSLAAGGGFGCQLIVASASAGLDASLSETVEFGSDLQAVPPAINAYVNMYSSLAFNAYFRTRVLFWRSQWSNTVAKTTVFQRTTSYKLLPNFPDVDLCSLWTPNDPTIDEEEDPALTFASTDCNTVTCAGVSRSCPEFGVTTACISPWAVQVPGSVIRYPNRSDTSVTIQNKTNSCVGTFCAWRPWRCDYHQGLDLYAPRGTPIYPAIGGYVIGGRASEVNAGGISVFIRSPVTDNVKGPMQLVHGYMHLDSLTPGIGPAVRNQKGDLVVTSDILIGYAGHTGTRQNACHQAHTHFRLYRDDRGQHANYDTKNWFSSPTPDWVTTADCPPPPPCTPAPR